MLNPYILLALALALAGSGYGGYLHGINVAEGEQAERDLLVANAYAEATRRNVAFESAESLRKAKAAAARRAKDREATHNLEMEIAKDEVARTCRVGAGTLGVLQRSIRATNDQIKAGGVDGAVRPVESAGNGDGSGTGTGITGRKPTLFERVFGQTKSGGLDSTQ